MKNMYITAAAATAIRHRNPFIAPKSMNTTGKTKKITAAAADMTTITKATPTSMNAPAGMTMTTKATLTSTNAAAGMTMTTKATSMSMMAAAVAAAKRSRKSIMTTRMTRKW